MKSGGWLTVLICLNLVLLTALVIFGVPARTAVAQGTGLAGNYLVVAGEIQDQFDALYLFDLQERALHTFYYQKGSNDLQYSGLRSLERDFRNR